MSLASRFTRWTYEQAKADKYADGDADYRGPLGYRVAGKIADAALNFADRRYPITEEEPDASRTELADQPADQPADGWHVPQWGEPTNPPLLPIDPYAKLGDRVTHGKYNHLLGEMLADRWPDPVDDEPDGDFDAIVRNPATGVPADVIARRAEYIATHGRNDWDRMLADVLADQAADDDPDGSADR